MRAYLAGAQGRYLVFAAVATLSFLVLYFMLARILPTVFADELVYSRRSRFEAFSSAVPDYLYLLAFRNVEACGPLWYGCVKLLNVTFHCLAAVLVTLTFRLYHRSFLSSVLVFAVAVFSPILVYASFFMPESMYYCMFWLFVFVMLWTAKRSLRLSALVSGVFLALAALVKPHALFLLPAACLFLLASGPITARRLRAAALAAVLLTGVTLATKLLVSVIAAGGAGVTILGGTYGGIASGTLGDTGRLFALAGSALQSAFGHGLGLWLLFGAHLPLLVHAAIVWRRVPYPTRGLVAFSLAAVIGLVGVTALFTAVVAGSGAFETAYRLHMRYYSFAFPLVYLAWWAHVRNVLEAGAGPGRRARLVLGGSGALLYAAVLLVGLQPYQSSFVDSPDLNGFVISGSFFRVMTVAAIGIMLVLCWSLSAYARLVPVWTAVVVVVSAAANVGYVQRARVPEVSDAVGQSLRLLQPTLPGANFLVVGPNVVDVMRTMFYLDGPASFEIVPPGQVLQSERVPASATHVVALDESQLRNFELFRRYDGFALFTRR